MFEWGEDEERWGAVHHPFTRPTDEWRDRFDEDPRNALAYAYDIIVNGNELGGGSFRIHEPDIQARVFDLLSLSEAEQRSQFGFLLDALAMGAPPHGGIALGIDRMSMVLAGEPNLRDVIAFPKNQAGLDPMSRRADGDHAGAARRARPRRRRRGGAELSARVVQRLLSLAAIALLAGLVAVAVVERRDEEPVSAPTGAVAAGGGWYEALAAPRPPGKDAERTSCGLVLTARSLGVTHPVLPCGAKLLIRYGGETVLTEVIDNDLVATGRQFELTSALAALVGLDGTQEVEWRYATRQ